jgi:hypothetical protein
MKRIGVLFGVENSFPSALVERINARNPSGIQAEFVQTGAVDLNQRPRYAVILDRISHEIPFYRAFLKNAALNGTVVINNPFWCSADDKFFNYALAARLGVAVPPTVLLPHKEYPNGTTSKSLRNLEFPLDWDGVFAAIGEHGFLKPIHGGGWRDVQEVRGRDEFFRAYDQSRDLCMVAPEGHRVHRVFPLLCRGGKESSHHALRSTAAARRTLPRRRPTGRNAPRQTALPPHGGGRPQALPRARLRLELGGIRGRKRNPLCHRLPESSARRRCAFGWSGQL